MQKKGGRSPQAQTATPAQAHIRSAVIIDDNETSRGALAHSLRALDVDVWLENDFSSAENTLALVRPDLVVAELKIGSTSALDFLRWLKQRPIGEHETRTDPTRFVIATFYPSVATAVQAIRLGADAYLAKPVDGPLMMSVIEEGNETTDALDHHWPSLDRTIWEYLNQVFMVSGSMSEAARRLRLDRRSLRRMLSKFPPSR